VFSYQFTSTAHDLLEAESVESHHNIAKPLYCWPVLLLGILFFAVGVATFVSSPNWQSSAWIFIGTTIIYFFAVKRLVRRHTIKQNNSSPRLLEITFTNDSIISDVDGLGKFTRTWEELSGYLDTRKGILFCFRDGVVNWLPNRVFTSVSERERFSEFVEHYYSLEQRKLKD
jgi:hypothetical protein